MPVGPREIARAQAEYATVTKDARERRRETFRKAHQSGMSMRQIALSAGLSKTRVAEILRGE